MKEERFGQFPRTAVDFSIVVPFFNEVDNIRPLYESIVKVMDALGHAYEMAAAGDVWIRFTASALPMLPGALEYAYRGTTTGGAVRNRHYLDGKVEISSDVTEEMRQILFDPQTSGGLLFAVPAEAVAKIESGFKRAGLPLWCVGVVHEGRGVAVVP